MGNVEVIGVRPIAGHQKAAGKPRFQMEAGAGDSLCQLSHHYVEVKVETPLQWCAMHKRTAKRCGLHSPGRAGAVHDCRVNSRRQ